MDFLRFRRVARLLSDFYITFALDFKTRIIMRKLLFMTVIVTSIVLTGCNVTRTITNQSEYYQKGDTSVVIQTRTVETYDASKKLY